MKRLILEDNAGRIIRFHQLYPQAVIVSTAQEAIDLFSKDDIWNWVSLDHDLNNEIFVDSNREDSGAEVARFIVAKQVRIDEIIIHSANRQGASIMRDILSDYNVKMQPFEGAYDPRGK